MQFRKQNKRPSDVRPGPAALCTPIRHFHPSLISLNPLSFLDSIPSSIYAKTDPPHSAPLDPFRAGPPVFSFPLPSERPSAAPTHTHLEMLLKTNWQNLGHGAVWGYDLLLSLGLRGRACPGSPRERRRRGRGEAGLSWILSGDAGNWQADERAWVGGGGSRGRESRNGGTGSSADSGNG